MVPSCGAKFPYL